jgi:pyridoxal phosphate enzyme (YggS family)
VSADRRAELEANLVDVGTRIAAAEVAGGREPGSVGLVVVTKTWPASDVRLLAGLGISDVAENRDQEARPKQAECADLGLRWHFVGQLQRNKARHVAAYADEVESVDRLELATALDRAAADAGRTIDVLLQVDLADPPQPHRGGVLPVDVGALADQVTRCAALRLRGLMAVAPLGEDTRAAFTRLADVAADLRRDHPEASVLSAGMSQDLEEAIAAGATHVRVGTAVLGGRPALR